MIQLRITKALYEEMRSDLLRSHPFASERIGYLFVKTSGKEVLVASGYESVPDEFYVKDKTVGARIDHRGIALAMKRADNNQEGILHVHIHPRSGNPAFSKADLIDHPNFLRSFKNATPKMPHGFLLLSNDKMMARVWFPGNESFNDTVQYTIVGLPLKFNWLATGINRITQNNRQSFLGDGLDELLANCLIGVIGLGGGGSQIVQQLTHIGFKRFVLYDYDIIEDTNLNRLVGASKLDVELKLPKMAIAIRLLRDLQPDAEITPVNKRWQDEPEPLKSCDIVFGCLDGYRNRSELESLTRRSMIPYIDIGMDVKQPKKNEPPRMSGQVIASIPGYPCMRCFGFLNEKNLTEEATNYGEAGIRPQVIWPNGILASTAVGLALNIMLNWTTKGQYQTLYYEYDGNKGTIMPHLKTNITFKSCIHYLTDNVGDVFF
jgi:Dinucleotide-utilizing enzymes involved in molybdopterin and thiamine biosynthesis family 2